MDDVGRHLRQRAGHGRVGRVDRHDQRLGVRIPAVDERIGVVLGVQERDRGLGAQRGMRVAQRDEPLDRVVERIRVVALGGDGRTVVGRVERQVQRVLRRGGEPGVRGAVPLHRRARAGAFVAALLGRQAVHVAHADLVAVVDERASRHRQQERERQFHPVLVEGVAHTRHVVVAGGDADVPAPGRRLGRGPVGVDERLRVAVRAAREVGVLAEQVEVVRRAEMQQEIHVEAGVQRLRRVAPLRDEHRIGKALVEEGADLAPQPRRPDMARVLLDQAAGHVHAEAVAAQSEPEGHDVLQHEPGRLRLERVGGELPVLGHDAEAVVERRLGGEAVDRGAFGAFRDAAQEPADRVVRRVRVALPGVGPDVAVRERVARGPGRFEEPRMVDGGVPGHEVEQHADAAGVRLVEQTPQVLVGAVARCGAVVVAHVVAGVVERGIEAGVDPDRVAAELADMVEPGDDAVEVADAVGVRVLERLRVDLIEHRVVEPSVHGSSLVGRAGRASNGYDSIVPYRRVAVKPCRLVDAGIGPALGASPVGSASPKALNAAVCGEFTDRLAIV